jgi:hypothetical protein
VLNVKGINKWLKGKMLKMFGMCVKIMCNARIQ